MMYKLAVGDNTYTNGDLERTIWHAKMILKDAHQSGLIVDKDYYAAYPQVASLHDDDLPWRHTTQSGITIMIYKTGGMVDPTALLMVNR